MKIAVVGLWHLGAVTAACLADQADLRVVGLDDDVEVVGNLQKGLPPLFEPGLEDLTRKGLATGRLSFSADPSCVADADIVWVNIDTPVDDQDKANVACVTIRVAALFPHLRDGAVVLISSQLPAGSTGRLQAQCAQAFPDKSISFAYSPENLRLGKAIDVFTRPERIVVGTSDAAAQTKLEKLLARYTGNILWMKTESAEMVKHSLNAFLATCITFINEIAEICEEVGADAAEVERGLRSEPRVGQKAYVKPGSAFAGGTLARDVNYLCHLADDLTVAAPLLRHINASNAAHKAWIGRKLAQHYGDLRGKKIAVLGLAYTPGTDTLRRSFAVELCLWLRDQGCAIAAYDPNIKTLPAELASFITLCASSAQAAENADALVIANEHPDYRGLQGEQLAHLMRTPLVIDQNGWIETTLAHAAITYVKLGKAA